MTVKELIEYLGSFPPDADVFYEDGNFGGPSSSSHGRFDKPDIRFKDGIVLIRSLYWEELE